MSSIESGSIPPEEVIEFVPQHQTLKLLGSLELQLSLEFAALINRKIEELKKDSFLLKSVLEEGEEIATIGTLKIGDTFKLVTTLPRDISKDKVYTVERFSERRKKRDKRKPKRYMVTTDATHFELNIYVIVPIKKKETYS